VVLPTTASGLLIVATAVGTVPSGAVLAHRLARPTLRIGLSPSVVGMLARIRIGIACPSRSSSTNRSSIEYRLTALTRPC
jgi:hypothetical protein